MRARVVAAAIDMLPVLVLLVGALVIRTVTQWPWWAPLTPVAAALVWTGSLWRGAAVDGRTVGKRAVGLAVIVESSGTVPGVWRALGRLAARGVLSLVTLGIAGLSYRWDPAGRQRTWWDRMTGTAVVRRSPDRPDDEAIARWAPAAEPRPPAPDAAGSAAARGTARGGWVPSPTSAVPASPPPVPPGPPPRPAQRHGRHSDERPGFLAAPLIGGELRAVPRGAPDVAAGSPGGRQAGAEPRLITGIGASPAGRLPPAAAPDPPSARRAGGAGVELIWDTGRRVTVTGRVLIGRDPAPADGGRADHLLPVTTESLGVSKTHLQMDIGPGGITVTDRRSTNGVRIVRADGSVDACPPGEPVPVRPGDAVHFGGRYLTVQG